MGLALSLNKFWSHFLLKAHQLVYETFYNFWTKLEFRLPFSMRRETNEASLQYNEPASRQRPNYGMLLNESGRRVKGTFAQVKPSYN